MTQQRVILVTGAASGIAGGLNHAIRHIALIPLST